MEYHYNPQIVLFSDFKPLSDVSKVGIIIFIYRTENWNPGKVSDQLSVT